MLPFMSTMAVTWDCMFWLAPVATDVTSFTAAPFLSICATTQSPAAVEVKPTLRVIKYLPGTVGVKRLVPVSKLLLVSKISLLNVSFVIAPAVTVWAVLFLFTLKAGTAVALGPRLSHALPEQ